MLKAYMDVVEEGLLRWLDAQHPRRVPMCVRVCVCVCVPVPEAGNLKATTPSRV